MSVWGARFASLARAVYSYMYMIFFYVGTFGGLPPPPIIKSWLRYCCQLSLIRRVAKWRWPIPSPPPPPLATRNRRHWYRVLSICILKGLPNPVPLESYAKEFNCSCLQYIGFPGQFPSEFSFHLMKESFKFAKINLGHEICSSNLYFGHSNSHFGQEI